jgi:hypothetical protein
MYIGFIRCDRDLVGHVTQILLADGFDLGKSAREFFILWYGPAFGSVQKWY